MMRLKILLALAVVSTITAFGQGIILWDESVHGPLSNDPGTPTSLGVIQLGANTLIGSAEFIPTGGGPGGTLYIDYVTFFLNAGTQISDMELHVDGSVAIWVGNANFSTELASVTSPANGSLLSQMGLQNIPVEDYGFYVANWQFGSSPSIANYRLDFIVQAIPEPSASSMLLVGAGLITLARWRKSRRRN